MNHTPSSDSSYGLGVPSGRSSKDRSSVPGKQKQPVLFSPSRRNPELEKINLIIDAALNLAPSRRKEFVERSCGKDEALQERILELIKRCGCSPPPDFLQPPVEFRRAIEKVYGRSLGL